MALHDLPPHPKSLSQRGRGTLKMDHIFSEQGDNSSIVGANASPRRIPKHWVMLRPGSVPRYEWLATSLSLSRDSTACW
uniref:Uncharacterized protein n=1 Tax=Planktothricoides sp. SpSt-374 TaxID=2282167 RepID=A0A7C3ZLT8_9CYAN